MLLLLTRYANEVGGTGRRPSAPMCFGHFGRVVADFVVYAGAAVFLGANKKREKQGSDVIVSSAVNVLRRPIGRVRIGADYDPPPSAHLPSVAQKKKNKVTVEKKTTR